MNLLNLLKLKMLNSDNAVRELQMDNLIVHGESVRGIGEGGRAEYMEPS